MEAFLAEVEWGTTIVAFVVAFGLGWLWYSPLLFMTKWMEGKGGNVVEHPMWMPMMAQGGSTLLFAMFANLTLQAEALWLYVLVTLTLAGFIKANGLFAGKTKYAIMVESSYFIAMALAVYVVHAIL